MRKQVLSFFLTATFIFSLFGMVSSVSANHCVEGTLSGTAVTTAPADAIFAVEGKITGICVEDPNDTTATIQGTLTVNGLPFNVPLGSQIDLGDPACSSLNKIDFARLADDPSLVGKATGIAEGIITVDAEGNVTHTAGCIFVEEAENGLIGVRTDIPSADSTFFLLGGVRVQMETDPRFEPFNQVIDEAGQTLTFDQIPAGTLVSAEGVYRDPDGILNNGDEFFSARLVEVGGVFDTGGATDSILISRAECRSNKLEMRVRGVASNPAALLTLNEVDAGGGLVRTLISNLPVSQLDNTWEFRGSVADSCPAVIQAVSDLGGTSEPVGVQIRN